MRRELATATQLGLHGLMALKKVVVCAGKYSYLYHAQVAETNNSYAVMYLCQVFARLTLQLANVTSRHCWLVIDNQHLVQSQQQVHYYLVGGISTVKLTYWVNYKQMKLIPLRPHVIGCQVPHNFIPVVTPLAAADGVTDSTGLGLELICLGVWLHHWVHTFLGW
jgi:hypothetical protein